MLDWMAPDFLSICIQCNGCNQREGHRVTLFYVYPEIKESRNKFFMLSARLDIYFIGEKQ